MTINENNISKNESIILYLLWLKSNNYKYIACDDNYYIYTYAYKHKPIKDETGSMWLVADDYINDFIQLSDLVSEPLFEIIDDSKIFTIDELINTYKEEVKTYDVIKVKVED